VQAGSHEQLHRCHYERTTRCTLPSHAAAWKGTKQTKACFEATKQQASAKIKKTGRTRVNKAKDSGPGQIGAAPFDGTRDPRRHARALEIYYSSTQYNHSNYCQRVREREANLVLTGRRSKLMRCGRQRGWILLLRRRKAFSKSKMRPFLSPSSVSLCTTLLSRDTAFCRGAYSLCIFSHLDLLVLYYYK
jgi:hypothetical protein